MGGVWRCGLLLMSAATACGAFVVVTPVAGPRSVRRAPATCSLPPSAAAHLEFADDARAVDPNSAWAGVVSGMTEQWAARCVDYRTHYDAGKLTSTGEWTPLSEGRALRFERLLSQGEFEVVEVAERGAVGPRNTEEQGRSDGAAMRSSIHRRGAVPAAVALRGGGGEGEGGRQVCATMLPGGGECRFASSGQAVAVSLVLSQDVAGVRGGYTQGVSVEYDAVTGLMLSLSRTDTRALVRAPAGGKTQTLEPLEPLEPLVPLTDPGGEVPWAGLDACVEPTVGGAAPYASFTALGAM